MYRTMCLHSMVRLAMAVVGLSLWAGELTYANLEDKLSGLTPGHEIGGYVYPMGGGDPIPLAPDIVGPDGTVTFVKPNVEIDKIEYRNHTTGGGLSAMSTIGGGDVYALLNIGDQFGLFESEFASLTTWHMVDAYDQSLGLEVGDSFYFSDGWSAAVPGVYLDVQGWGYSGDASVYGFNLVTPEPASLALLAFGTLALAPGRRARA